MFLLIRKLLTCLTAGYQTLIYRLSLMLNLVRKLFSALLKEEQDLYQVVEFVPLMSTVTGGWSFMSIQIKFFQILIRIRKIRRRRDFHKIPEILPQ